MSLAGGEVVVVGAGIAGLATACALARQGAQVTVLERADRIAEVGAGIQISPNGLAVIDALGLGEAVREAAVAADAVELRDGLTGRPVLSLDLARYGRGRSWLFIPRARLIDALLAGARAAGVRLELGAEVEKIGECGDGVALTLAGAGIRHASLAIGADGGRGRLRQAVDGAEPARFTGQVAWRAVVPGAAPSRALVHLGPGRHLVSYPLPGARINLVAVEERGSWAEESWTAEADPEDLRRAFSSFTAAARELVDRVARVDLWGLFRHPVARQWHSRRIALVGDAAHPSLPFLAQGANLALEDAWALADCLARLPDPLAAYQRRRRPRAVRVVAAASANARNYHLRPPMRGAAHALLRTAGALAPGRAVARFDWLYGHDETRR